MAGEWKRRTAWAGCTLNPVGHVPSLRNQSRCNHLVESDAGSQQRLGPLTYSQNRRHGEGHTAVPF